MRIKVDLHIHSALSPCADDLMTPGNIVGMALLNGLDAIAVTDHNSTLNIASAMAQGEQAGVIVIPAIEIETVEEIHVVCLFPRAECAYAFGKVVNDSYAPIMNKPEIFGKQQIFDEEDCVSGEWQPLLITPSGISIDDVFDIVESFEGVAYPAHVDRDSYSVLTTLGSMPYGYRGAYAEISKECDETKLLMRYPELKNYKLIRASDAHYIDRMLEPGYELDVEEKTIIAIISSLKFR